jgi:hypothetical protein
VKDRFCETVEKGRIPEHPIYPPTNRGDKCGVFFFRSTPKPADHLMVIASDGYEWEMEFPPPAFEHVSISVKTNGKESGRCPTWEEMDWVCRLFWGPDETAIQYHPPMTKKVNHHPHCLHLWKPIGVEIPIPPAGTLA